MLSQLIRWRSLAVLTLTVALVGCGNSDGRITVSGTITHGGEPVPVGLVRFEPDRARGGKGPVGFAGIIDGKYTTSRGGKGPKPGPVKMMVTAQVSNEAYAPDLFPPQTLEIEVSSDQYVFDLDVPKN